MRQAVENSWKNFAKNFQKFLPALAVAVVPEIGVAREGLSCGARASVGNVVHPWQDNSRGFALPGLFVLPREGFSNAFLLSFTLNQASGEIFADMALGPQ